MEAQRVQVRQLQPVPVQARVQQQLVRVRQQRHQQARVQQRRYNYGKYTIF